MPIYGRNKGELNRRKISQITGNELDNEILREQYKKSEDSKVRESIHNDIIKMINAGKGKIEILTFLNNKYSDSNYSKYFEGWYDHHKSRMGNERPFQIPYHDER